jgi:hypothetical protein
MSRRAKYSVNNAKKMERNRGKQMCRPFEGPRAIGKIAKMSPFSDETRGNYCKCAHNHNIAGFYVNVVKSFPRVQTEFTRLKAAK